MNKTPRITNDDQNKTTPFLFRVKDTWMTTKGAGGYMEGSSLPGHPAGYPPQPLDTPHQVTDNKSFLFFFVC